MPHKQSGIRVPLRIKMSFLCLAENAVTIGKRLFTHPSIFTFNHVMNASGTKLLKSSKLYKLSLSLYYKLSLRMLKDKKNVVILLYAFLINK